MKYDFEKIIIDFIKDNKDRYFLLLEEENYILICDIYNDLTDLYKENELLTMKEIILYLEDMLLTNDELLSVREDIERDKFLNSNFGFYFQFNKEEVVDKYKSGELKTEYKE